MIHCSFITSMRQLYSYGYGSQILWVLRDNPVINFYRHMSGKLITEKTENIGEKIFVSVPLVGTIPTGELKMTRKYPGCF